MKFWEAVGIALGMQSKGIAPPFLTMDKVSSSGPIKIEWKAVAEITNDEVLIAKMVHDLFIDRRVMHGSMEKEQVAYVLDGLKDLRTKVDVFMNRFIGSVSTKDRLYASLLLAWSSAAKVAISSIEDATTEEAKDRKAHRRFAILEASDILYAQDSLHEILSAFRRDSFPPVAPILDLLSPDRSSRTTAEKLLAGSKAFLLQKYAAGGENSLEPGFNIEL